MEGDPPGSYSRRGAQSHMIPKIIQSGISVSDPMKLKLFSYPRTQIYFSHTQGHGSQNVPTYPPLF